MSQFPNQGGMEPYNDQGLKQLLFNMMLNTWKIDFVKSGNDLSSPAYTYLELSRYMSLQEQVFNKHISGVVKIHVTTKTGI